MTAIADEFATTRSSHRVIRLRHMPLNTQALQASLLHGDIPLHRSDNPRSKARIGSLQYAHPDAPKPIHPDKEQNLLPTIRLGTNIRQPSPQTFTGIEAKNHRNSIIPVTASLQTKPWWRWTESNRRPPACKAGALPIELHPQSLSGPIQTSLRSVIGAHYTKPMVGQGGLEPPTPRLSSVCSNQLSY